MRVTFLTVMPSPYVQDLFEAMASDPRLDLRVLYLEQEAPDTYWGIQTLPDYAQVLPGRWVGISGARVHVNPSVRRELAGANQDITVVVGYIGLTNQIAMRTLSSRGLPWAFWGEVPGFHNRGPMGRTIRGWLQRPLRGAWGIAGVGQHAVEAYRQIVQTASNPAADSQRSPVYCNLPYTCRSDGFATAAQQRTSDPCLRLLYCGQLIERKGVDVLLSAFAQLVADGVDARLTLVGEGPMREPFAAGLAPAVASRVDFAGFCPVDELPQRFAAHDVFVLPSRHDGWGVVINQAVAAGMPVIASTAVGAAGELVEPGANGFRVPPGDAAELADALRRLADVQLRTAMARRSQQIAERVSMAQSVDRWHDFLQAAVRSR